MPTSLKAQLIGTEKLFGLKLLSSAGEAAFSERTIHHIPPPVEICCCACVSAELLLCCGGGVSQSGSGNFLLTPKAD
jgi:hypothetical protein